MARALVNVPKTARRGQIIEIKALVSHPMETGYRPGPEGRIIPRDIITRFTCHYDREVVFSAELHPAVSANPYFAFTTVATASGTITPDLGRRQRLPSGRDGDDRGDMRLGRTIAALAALLACGSLRAEIAPNEKRSDTESLAPSTRAMQADDVANPGMLAVLDGEALWSAGPKSCAGCHGEATSSMRGVAARYPTWDGESGQAVDLAGRIDLCRSRHQGQSALAPESATRLALTTYVAHASRGQPIAPSPGPAMDAVRERGRALFGQRMGQINLSCATCHDANWGKSLAGTPIPQAHPVGYPIYRLEWQSIGSLQTPLPQLHDGGAGRALPLRSAGTRRTRSVSDGTGRGPVDRDAGRPALNAQLRATPDLAPAPCYCEDWGAR